MRGNPDGMSAMVDVLQCLGVEPDAATAFAMKVIKAPHEISFVEIYGGGALIDAAASRQRNLHVKGLKAFDLRTLKDHGSRWDFDKKSPTERRPEPMSVSMNLTG